MGKVEKELINSYYHTREIEIGQHGGGRYTLYEAAYLFINNKLAIEDTPYSDKDIDHIITKNPKLLDNPTFFNQIPGQLLGFEYDTGAHEDKFTPEFFNNLSDKQIVDFITSLGRDVFHLFSPERLKAIKGMALSKLLKYRGQHFKLFNLNNLDGKSIVDYLTNYHVLTYKPKQRDMLLKLINFDKLEEFDIINLLRYDAKYIDYVDVSKITHIPAIKKLLEKSPQLTKDFIEATPELSKYIDYTP